jgi:ABC-type sulfate transport system substrate-binding protein
VKRLREKDRFIAPALNQIAPKNTPQVSSPASPYTSTIVYVVRKNNPKGVADWDDLLQRGIEVVTPNPKISQSGRWNYLAAWGYALRQQDSNEAVAFEFLRKLFANVRSFTSADFVERVSATCC